MTRQALSVCVIATMLLLAGCAGSSPSPPATASTDGTARATNGAATPQPTDTGTVAFYISDEENAIDDFAHLNVTVTKLGFERVGSNGSDGGWVAYEVDNATVDLTELQGERATLVDAYEIPTGTYRKVFVHVSAVNGTLDDGEQVRVKLPSEKLQLEMAFTVGSGSEVVFVFDITVHKAGNSGKYILTPVVGESGTDVPIEPTDDELDDNRGDGSDVDALEARFTGTVSPGANATLVVTHTGSPVEDATVLVNGEPVGVTDADGELTFMVPDAETLTVTVRVGEAEIELEREFESDDDN